MYNAGQYVFDQSALFDPQHIRKDANGKVWMYVTEAHGDLTALTPYTIVATSSGYKSAAIAQTDHSSTITSILMGSGSLSYVTLGVPKDAIGSGLGGWLQIGGYIPTIRVVASCSSTINVGILLVSDAIVIATSVAFSGGMKVNEVGFCAASENASSLHSAYLIPKLSMSLA